MNISFLYLTAFCVTGGIEKFNKSFIKALGELAIEKNFNLKIMSAYDTVPDERYINKNFFKGFGKRKISFVILSLIKARVSGIIFLGHINLAPVGLLLKIFNPTAKLILITHGTEVWEKLSFLKTILYVCILATLAGFCPHISSAVFASNNIGLTYFFNTACFSTST